VAFRDRRTVVPELPNGTVAFRFTDIEGSIKSWERDSPAMWAAVERHIALLEGALKKGWPSGHPSPDCFGS
jgi:hypothetical protein